MMTDPERDDESFDFESVITPEVEFLEAVYINELVLERNELGRPIRVGLQLHPATAEDTDQQYVCLNLAFVLPADYPKSLPEIHIKNPRGLAERHVQSIRDTLHGMAKERKGTSMLYDLIEYTKESLNEENIPHGQCVICLEQFCESDIFKKTECYHYFHSHCLLRYVRHCLKAIEEEQMQTLRHKSFAERQVVCPVCREPLTYDVEALEKHPEPSGEKDTFIPDSALRERQRMMAEMFEKQKLKGGIIDVEAERNKFYIALGQKTELAETDTSEEASDIASTAENPVLTAETERPPSSEQGHDGGRYRGRRYEYGNQRGYEKHRRRGMSRGIRHQSERHKPSKEGNRQHYVGDRFLNGEDEFLSSKPADHRQRPRMGRYHGSDNRSEDRDRVVDDKKHVVKNSNLGDDGADAKKGGSVEDHRGNKEEHMPGHAQRSLEINHLDCDVKAEDGPKTEMSKQTLDDESVNDNRNDFDSRKVCDKPSQYSGRHKPFHVDSNRHRKSYGKPSGANRRNVGENRRHTPGTNENISNSEDRHIRSRFRDPEGKCFLKAEREYAVAGTSHFDKDEKGCDDTIPKAASTGEKKNFRKEAFCENRSRKPGSDNIKAEHWPTAEDESIVHDNTTTEERAEDNSKEDTSHGRVARVENKPGRHYGEGKMRKHAEKTDPKYFRKNQMYHQERKKYPYSGQKPREVEKTSNYPRKGSDRHCPVPRDESLEVWSVDYSCSERKEKKRIVGPKLKENQRTSTDICEFERCDKRKENISEGKNRFASVDNYAEDWSVISSSEGRATACAEREPKNVKHTVQPKKLPRENYRKYAENNCDIKNFTDDISVDSLKKWEADSREKPRQWDETGYVIDGNAVGNKVGERNCSRLPPGFHTVGPPPGFQSIGNIQASGSDFFR